MKKKIPKCQNSTCNKDAIVEFEGQYYCKECWDSKWVV